MGIEGKEVAVSELKIKKVEEIKNILKEKENFVIITYGGIGVPAQNDLRFKISQKQSVLKVVKNNLFWRALCDVEAYANTTKDFEKDLKGSLAVAFVSGNFQPLSKLLLDHGKKEAKIKVKSACLEGKYLSFNEVTELANLPSREDMLAIIARGLNTPVTKLARGLQEIIATLARGIEEVAKKEK